MAEPTPLESLQQKLDTNSLNPREYNTEQLSTIDNLIEQGVLKGPRMSDIVQNFNTTAETLAEEKEFAKLTEKLYNKTEEFADYTTCNI